MNSDVVKGELQNQAIDKLGRLKAFLILINTDNEKEFNQAYKYLTGRNGSFIFGLINRKYYYYKSDKK